MTFYTLEPDGYTVAESSNVLNKIKLSFLVKYVNRRITESPLVIKKDFQKII